METRTYDRIYGRERDATGEIRTLIALLRKHPSYLGCHLVQSDVEDAPAVIAAMIAAGVPLDRMADEDTLALVTSRAADFVSLWCQDEHDAAYNAILNMGGDTAGRLKINATIAAVANDLFDCGGLEDFIALACRRGTIAIDLDALRDEASDEPELRGE